MRICIYGAGAIGGYLGVQLALAGEEITLIARGGASGGYAEEWAQIAHRWRRASSTSVLHGRSQRSGPSGLRDHHAQGALGSCDRAADAADARTGYGSGQCSKRRAVVVLPRPRGSVARPPPRDRRSGWSSVGRYRARARHRLRRVSSNRGRGAWSDPASGRQPFHPGRAIR